MGGVVATAGEEGALGGDTHGSGGSGQTTKGKGKIGGRVSNKAARTVSNRELTRTQGATVSGGNSTVAAARGGNSKVTAARIDDHIELLEQKSRKKTSVENGGLFPLTWEDDAYSVCADNNWGGVVTAIAAQKGNVTDFVRTRGRSGASSRSGGCGLGT